MTEGGSSKGSAVSGDDRLIGEAEGSTASARRVRPRDGVPVRGLGSAGTSDTFGERPPLPRRCAAKAVVSSAASAIGLVVRGKVRQPRTNVGRRVHFADGSDPAVYRETVIDRPPPREPAVLVVCFRLRRVRSEWAHRLFRIESEGNTLLFAGFPGLVSKLWFRHDQHGCYRGFYQWDGTDAALDYVRALSWVLALVSERGSIHYTVLPGLDRDEVLRDPTVIDQLDALPGGWWRPTGEPGQEP